MLSPCFSDKNMDLYCNLNEITLGCGTVKDKGVFNWVKIVVLYLILSNQFLWGVGLWWDILSRIFLIMFFPK